MDDKKFLKKAVEVAKKSVELCGFPAGAVVVKDGEVVSEGVSIGYLECDPTGHAETSAIRKACQSLKTYNLTGATLYESLEGCNMCFSVANWAGISRIVYGCRRTSEMVEKNYYEGLTDSEYLNRNNNRQIELVFVPGFEEEIKEEVRKWEQN